MPRGQRTETEADMHMVSEISNTSKKKRGAKT